MSDFRGKYSAFELFDELDLEFAENVESPSSKDEGIFLVSLIASHASKNNSVCFDCESDSFEDDTLNLAIHNIIDNKTRAKFPYDKNHTVVIEN